MNNNYKVLRSGFLFFVVAAVLNGCAYGKKLNTGPAERIDTASGTYTVYMYGCKYPRDIKDVAILDKEGDDTTITIDAPDKDYIKMTGIPAESAFKDAEKFVGCSYFFQKAVIREILGPDGRVFGYELRPLYLIRDFGIEDVLDIEYFINGSTIKTTIKLKPGVEQALEATGPYQFRRTIPSPETYGQ